LSNILITAEVQKRDKIELRVTKIFLSTEILARKRNLIVKRKDISVVATTRRNGTRSLLTSAKLTEGYLVVGITRELDKKPSLYYLLYIYMAPGPCYNNIYLALKSMPLPHVLLLIHMCFP